MTNPPTDKSPKGFIDGPIHPFMSLLNPLPSYCTTSSCSGRIAIFASKTSSNKGFWVFVSHYAFKLLDTDTFDVVSDGIEEEVTRNNRLFGESRIVFENEMPEISNELQLVSLKFEPFILHVKCSSLESAQKLLQIALQSGYANSGLVVGSKNIMVQIKSPLKLDIPIGYFDKTTDTFHLIVSAVYLRFLIKLGHKKLTENTMRMEILLNNLRELNETE